MLPEIQRMTLVRVCTFKRWQQIAGDFNFASCDIKDVTAEVEKKLNSHRCITEYSPFHDRRGTSRRYRSRRGYYFTVAELEGDYVLARSTAQKCATHVEFVILNAKTQEVLKTLHLWSIHPNLLLPSNHSESQKDSWINKGGKVLLDRRVPPLRFDSFHSNTKRFILVVGPAEGISSEPNSLSSVAILHQSIASCTKINGQESSPLLARRDAGSSFDATAHGGSNQICRPGVKLFDVHQSTAENLVIKYGQSRLWPVAAVFHPDPAMESTVIVIASDQSTLQMPRDEMSGLLMHLDVLTQRIVCSYADTPMSSALLRFVRGGEQVLSVEGNKSFPEYRQIYIFKTCELQVLAILPLLPICKVEDLMPVYSLCESKVALIMWKRQSASLSSAGIVGEDSNGGPSGNSRSREASGHSVDPHAGERIRDSSKNRNFRVKRGQHSMTVAIFRINTELLSLYKICTNIILGLVVKDKIHHLPLPKAVKCALANNKRY